MGQQDSGKAPAPEAASAQQQEQQEQQAKAQAAARLRALAEQQRTERQHRDERQRQKREAETEQPDVEALLAQDMRLAQEEEEARRRELQKKQEREARKRQEEQARQERARLEQARREQAQREKARRAQEQYLEQARLRREQQERQAQAANAARAAAAQQRKDRLRRCKIVCGLLLFLGFDQCFGILLQGASTVFAFLRDIGISVPFQLLPLFGPALLTAGAHLLHKLPAEERFPTLRGLCPWLWTAPLYNIAIGAYLAGTLLRVFGSGHFLTSLFGAAVLVVLNIMLTDYLDARLQNWLLPKGGAF